ncbi:MAG TPA: hypothetical protein VN253_24275, partial [Kofleriaceae bacterium]|nr:hypothetical protein [Kofleriaceae bacterium]
MRAGWIAVIVAASTGAARAEPRLDASGFLGVGSFGDSGLGDARMLEQAPGAAPVIGARVGWLAMPRLARDDLDLSLGVEAELAIAAAF